MIEGRVFSPCASKKCPNILGKKTEKEFLEKIYKSPFSFGIMDLMERGQYLIDGWKFDFKPWLKKYIYKSYGFWQEAYAPNKTLLRNALNERVEKIVEIN